MLQELEDIKEKYRQLTLSLSDSASISDPQKIKKIARERSSLEPIVKKYEDYNKVTKDIKESEEILADSQSDPELEELAEDELKKLQKRKEQIEEELKILLLPTDPNDEKNVLLGLEQEPEGMKRLCLPRIYSGCIQCMRKRKNGK
jgi:peptide chain release factor 1